MKIKLSKEQINFLNKITKGKEFEKDIKSFEIDKEFDLKNDLADELRDLCAEYEIDNIQEHKYMSLDENGRIAYDLVNLLCN